MDIAEFIEARLAEREALALKTAAAADDAWHWDDSDPERTAADATFQLLGDDHIILEEPGVRRGETSAIPFIAANDPAWVLRDVAAKRAIVSALRDNETGWKRGDAENRTRATVILALRFACVHLAAADSAHPDYDPEWAPRNAKANVGRHA